VVVACHVALPLAMWFLRCSEWCVAIQLRVVRAWLIQPRSKEPNL